MRLLIFLFIIGIGIHPLLAQSPETTETPTPMPTATATPNTSTVWTVTLAENTQAVRVDYIVTAGEFLQTVFLAGIYFNLIVIGAIYLFWRKKQ